MFREKLIVEGVQPEKALVRLQKAGIDVFHAKKIKKNQILFTVSKKDSEKVFAIPTYGKYASLQKFIKCLLLLVSKPYFRLNIRYLINFKKSVIVCDIV